MRLLLALLCACWLSIQAAAYDKECVQTVYKEAEKYTEYPSTILAMAKAETSCRNVTGDDGESHGVMQVQIPTLRWLATKEQSLRWVKHVPDKALKHILTHNRAFCVMVGCKLFEYHRKRHGYFGAISRYNGGTKNYTYYNKVQRILKEQ